MMGESKKAEIVRTTTRIVCGESVVLVNEHRTPTGGSRYTIVIETIAGFKAFQPPALELAPEYVVDLVKALQSAFWVSDPGFDLGRALENA